LDRKKEKILRTVENIKQFLMDEEAKRLKSESSTEQPGV
jgi:hypothetical protein